MKQIYHVILGLLAFIFMGLAYLFIKIFGIMSSKKQDVKDDKPWLESFVILYLNKCLILDSDIIDLAQLSQGKLNFGEEQSLLVYLKAYLYKIGETYEPNDYISAVGAIPRVWSIYVPGYRSESAVRTWIQSQGGSKEEQDEFVSKMKQADMASEDWLQISMTLLEFRIGRTFVRLHGQDFSKYTENMLEEIVEPTTSDQDRTLLEHGGS